MFKFLRSCKWAFLLLIDKDYRLSLVILSLKEK